MAETGLPAAVYRELLRAQVRIRLEYRASFLIDVLTNACVSAIEVVGVLAMFHVTRSLAGFSIREVLVMAGLSGTAFATADLVFGSVERLPATIAPACSTPS